MPESPRRYQSAREWPPWTDAYRFIPADAGPYIPPGEADREWAATNGNETEIRDIDQAAGESESLDRMENGFPPE